MKHLWMSPFPYVHKIYSPHWVAIFSVFNNPVPASWWALLFMPGDRIARVTTVLTAIGDATPTAAQQTLCWGSTKRRTQHSNMWCCFTSSYFEPFASYLLNPWSRVLLENLTGFQLVKKFPAFHGTPRFITAVTRSRHLSLPWASSIQSISPHPTSWNSILILSCHLCLGLPSPLFHSGLILCFRASQYKSNENTNLMQHCAGFISAGSLYMFRAQAPIIRSI